jgi:hypothetical protein
MIRHHFNPLGLCPNGHRLEVPLADRLTAWIKAEGITGEYPPDEIAARVIAQRGAGMVGHWLACGDAHSGSAYITGYDDNGQRTFDHSGTAHLRWAATHCETPEDLTDTEFATELHHHGHR